MTTERPASDELGCVEAELTLRPTADGGRNTPIRSGYRPNWWLLVGGERINAGGTVELVDGDAIAPGRTARVRIHPFVPESWRGVVVGTRLEVNEGPTLVGDAVATRIVRAVSLDPRSQIAPSGADVEGE